MKGLKVALAGVGVLAVLGGVGWWSYTQGMWRFVEADRVKYPVRGIDVSHHQGAIDWTQVAGDDVAFAFVKATEGGDHVDSRYTENMAGAKGVGLAAAPYHFFTLCKDGKTQAANFVKVTGGVSSTLPVVVDLEFVGNCKARPEVMAVRKELQGFVDEVEKVYPRKALFYTTYAFYDKYLAGAFGKHRVWIRDVFGHPAEGRRAWDFWQYGDHARVKGVTGPVDVNVFRGSKEDWVNYAGFEKRNAFGWKRVSLRRASQRGWAPDR